MLISLKRPGQIVIIWQCGTNDETTLREIGRHIEIIMFQRFRLSLHARTHSLLQSLCYLRTLGMIGKVAIILAHIVKDYCSILLDQSYTKVLTLMRLHKIFQLCLCHTHAIHHFHTVRKENATSLGQFQILCQQFIIVGKFQSQRTNLILFLACLLKYNKTDSEHKEHRQYAEIQLFTYIIQFKHDTYIYASK